MVAIFLSRKRIGFSEGYRETHRGVNPVSAAFRPAEGGMSGGETGPYPLALRKAKEDNNERIGMDGERVVNPC
jgi:hypothetical protein